MSLRRTRGTFLARTQTTTHGEPVETFAAAGSVWCALKAATGNRGNVAAWLGRMEHPVDRIATVDPHDAAVAGNRFTVGGVTYDITGVEDSSDDAWLLALSKVIRQ